MAHRDDFYASPFGAAYSAYMQRPRLSRLIARLVWGADVRLYYESMRIIGEAPTEATILDCPCGAGAAFGVIPRCRDGRYLAADLSPSMLGRARRQASRRGLDQLEFIEADAGTLPLEDQSVDLYLSYWGLHCFYDPGGALREAVRILKPAGRFVGSTFLAGDDTMRQRLLVKSGRGDFGRVGSELEMRAWFEEAGLEIEEAGRSGPMLFFSARA